MAYGCGFRRFGNCAMAFAAASVAVHVCTSVEAKTVAWYRFEDAADGVTTQETVFTNTVDASLYPAYPAVCAFSKNGQYTKGGLSYGASHMPIFTNAFPALIALVDANDTKSVYENRSAVAMNMGKVNDNKNPSAAVFIDDHEDLRLQNGTIEFFARLPDATQSWRCLFSRIGGAYTDKQTTFRIHGQLFTTGNMYLILRVAALESEALRDDSGSVTNGVSYQASASFDESHIDDDRWHHIALVIDGEAKTVTLYVDYVARATVNYVGRLLYDEGFPFTFGADPQCTYFGSAEAIDEIRFSDEPLKPSQMLRYAPKTPSALTVFDESTLFYFPFEGKNEDVTVGAGDMANPITYNPFLRNCAVRSEYFGVDASFYAKSTNGGQYDPTSDASDIPAASTRQGLRSQSSTANAQSLHSVTNGTGAGFLRSAVLPATITAADLCSGNFTVECFMKMSESGYMADTNQCQLLCLWNGFQVKTICRDSQWNNGMLQFAVGKTDLHNARDSSATKNVADGRWHHVAVVYDKDEDRAEAYIDYELVLWADSVVMEMTAHNSYYNGFMIGGSYWNDRHPGNVWFDDVRISRGALRPHRFITRLAAEPDVLASASFDGSLAVAPYTNFFGDAWIAMPSAAGGAAPGGSAAHVARVIAEGRNGKVWTDRNSGSLAVNGGTVVYPGRRLLADEDEFTVEFFMRAETAAAGTGVMRVNRGTSAEMSNAVTWALSFADADGRLKVNVDTDASEGQSHAFSGETFSDGKWHHVALAFAREGDDTLVRLYRDAAECGEWLAKGHLITQPRLMNFMIGGSEDGAAGFIGNIDELRVSPGVVDPERLLAPVFRGMTVVVR